MIVRCTGVETELIVAAVAQSRPDYPSVILARFSIEGNHHLGSKCRKRLVKKQIQFVTEEALEKRIVSMFLHYNDDPGKRKVRCWREIVAYYEAK